MEFSPDGKQLAVGLSTEDRSKSDGDSQGAISIWDLATAKIRHRLTGLGNFVTSVVFTPDGKRLVSGDWDQTVTIWDLTNGRPVGNMKT
ncbi:unnamed protein product, partial [marine sediment metagenome]